ncbi:MAG: (E)-4-hydroxy-3-methylbut-2-enyl-diphosphate synthase [Chitinophagaceae bacterium]|nr:(E)-4-hydroxy-3-methylbut-2-enyl-diphosphate synthase [Chitinophagaceae bacterium]
MSFKYCNSLTSYSRLKTREVKVGDLIIGGNHPIRIQSMTTTDTMDTIATVEQSIRMIEAGCELVRITAPSINEAHNLAEIKNELKARGYTTPLVADIHFTPNAAEVAARIVEKVRVNPGNYADKKKFQVIEYSDADYEEELDRIRGKFLPLIKICKEYGTAMRIGTNHGSLSDRIMSRYGDTPLGMVESAFEFLRIAESEGYYNIVLSMKSSNPQVMVQAYRLLVNKMQERAINIQPQGKESDSIYPLHLGVTEAGDGEDGRIKSAIGIGALLEDGLGDTIRVSLTEDPELELPVAKTLVYRYTPERKVPKIATIKKSPIHPFEYNKRTTVPIENIGAHHVPVVVMDFSEEKTITPETLLTAGYRYDPATDKWNIGDMAADYIFTGGKDIDFAIPGTLGIIKNADAGKNDVAGERTFRSFNASQFLSLKKKDEKLKFVIINIDDISDALIDQLKKDPSAVIVLTTDHFNGMMEQRRVFFDLITEQVENPVIIKRSFENILSDELTLYAATDFGALLLDGLGDGIWLHAPQHLANTINRLCFGILQGTRQRISKTEYISCPSCGRTLFDLQETTAAIRARTNHLKGVKIAIMGCIVNGPGEMADADYGYVGSGVGKITLYKGKEVVKRSVESLVAVDELILLIKENGDWVEGS